MVEYCQHFNFVTNYKLVIIMEWSKQQASTSRSHDFYAATYEAATSAIQARRGSLFNPI